MSEESEASNSILVLLVLLTLTTFLGHILQSRHARYLQEATVGVVIGLVTGFMVQLIFGKEETYLNFNVEFFMLVLLPPIIFESGYNLNRKYFFKNIGAILLYAFLGTIISILVTSILLIVTKFFDINVMTIQEICAFSTLISATDTISILTIMQQMGVDKNLHSLIFGESAFNDAVTIVLYRTILGIQNVNEQEVYSCIGMFLVIFLGSLAIGAFFALFSSFLLKQSFSRIERHRYNVEACVMIIGPWVSYLVAEAISMSGIVSILFAGILMSIYTYPNLTRLSKAVTKNAYTVIAHAAEILVFILMGLHIGQNYTKFPFSKMGFMLCFFSIIFIYIGRAANIWGVTQILNIFRSHKKITAKFQFVMWFSGLRGSFAFALAIQAQNTDYSASNGGNGDVILTLTLIYALFTVIVMASTMNPILDKLDVKQQEKIAKSDEKMKHNTSQCKYFKKQINQFHENYMKNWFINQARADQLPPQEDEEWPIQDRPNTTSELSILFQKMTRNAELSNNLQ